MDAEPAKWVVLDAVLQVMRCDRCQATEPLAQCVGKPIGEAAAIMNKFVDAHRACVLTIPAGSAAPTTTPRHGQPWLDTSRPSHARERLYDAKAGEWVSPDEFEFREQKNQGGLHDAGD